MFVVWFGKYTDIASLVLLFLVLPSLPVPVHVYILQYTCIIQVLEYVCACVQYSNETSVAATRVYPHVYTRGNRY